jgi:N-methylhydantoinase A/oxoprolinase/acetone carboxylase beta subunit
VPWHSRAQAKQAFVALHRQRFGYDHDTELELVNLRSAVTAQGVELVLPRADSENTNRSTKSAANRVHSTHPASSAATDGSGAYPSIRREALDEHEREGPLVIIELAATTFVAPGWCAKRDAIGNIELRKR